MGVMDEPNMRSLKKTSRGELHRLENNGHGPIDFGLDISLRVARWLGG